MKKTVSIIFLLAVAIVARAQKVTFYSPTFEEGVKAHLGLDATSDVQQAQMDTITAITLSGRGITDIRDAVYLPVVRKLDLSYNEIDDVSALLPLDSLRYLDLSNNLLENINVLALSNVDTLEVDVSNNFIGDFSYFYSPTHCEFTFLGMGLQKVKDAPFFEVYQLFADVIEDETEVAYRGYTNMDGISLVCAGRQTPAVLDGESRSAVISGDLTQTTEVILTNGERHVSTWVIPPMTYVAYDSDRITIPTGLPSTYRISSLSARHGTVSTSGDDELDIVYEAPTQAVVDVIDLSYYEGRKLKGFAQINISDVMKGDVNKDKKVSIFDAVQVVSKILGNNPSPFTEKGADVDGNGNITIFDAVSIVNIILNQGSGSQNDTEPQ